MSQILRWGVLGAANFARKHLAPALMLAKNNQFAALATSSMEKAEPFKALNPSLKIHLNYDDLIADPEIDVIYIPLPNHLHVEWVKKAAAAGKHVLCEKPIAMRASEIDELIRLRDSAQVLIAEAYMIVHHPQWQLTKEKVQSGSIGELVQVDAVFSYNNAADPNNIRNRPETGGGSLRDIGVYTLGGTRFVTGKEPLEILHTDIQKQNSVDTWTQVCAAFPGFRFTSTTSMRMSPRQEICFHGTEGYLKLTAPFNPSVFDQAEVHLCLSNLSIHTQRFPAVNHYVLQLENFHASVTQGVPYPCPLEFTRGTQAMIDSIFA